MTSDPPWRLQFREGPGGSPFRQVDITRSAHLRRPGPRCLTGQQSAHLYELTINRHRVSSFVITSNRAVEEWLSLFDDSILGNSALDRLANASFQIVIEGASYREKLSPHRKLLGDRGGD